MRIDQRLKRVQDLFLFSAVKNLETVTLDTEDLEVLLDLAINAGEKERDNQWLYGKLNMISDIIENGRQEVKVDIGIETESERIEFNNKFFGTGEQIEEIVERMEKRRKRFSSELLK